ncbi:trigger factor [Spiroplasma sp. AdecLV25b]|uniref:trigger factor n=1 Tax=Spiroplasma sp. AdecLV25b TaxID=3027162 RepID=UPI0027E17477|nr:trigger factor [Spiroplasma sp. AdecLV25b]
MKLEIKKDEKNGQGKWHVILDDKVWKKQLDKAETKLINQVEILGFRKGKVPTKLAKKHVKPESIIKTATQSAVGIAYDFALSQKPDLMPTNNQPEVQIIKNTDKECEILFFFDLPSEIVLGQYRDLKIAKPTPSVTDEEVDEQIKLLQDRFAIFAPKEDGDLALGDTAIFDFTGFLDGEKFAGGESKGMELEIGSGKFIPGFEEQMVGMKKGTKKTFEVTFPEEYHVATLKGQLVKFEVELHEIKTKTINDNLEELVKDVNIPDVTTYEQLLVNVKQQIELQKTMTIKEQFMEELIAKIVKNSKIFIPNYAVKIETDRLEAEFKKQLASQNFTIENYIAATGISHEEIRKEIEKDAITQLQNFLIIKEVIEKEKIEVTEAEFENHLLGFANQFKVTIEEVKKNIKDLSLVTTTLKRNKAFDLLWDNNGTVS